MEETAGKKASYDFDDIVRTITNQPYEAEHFSEYEKGKLYTIEVKPTTQQRINFAVDFEFDSEKAKVLTNGFNGYERDSKKVRITAWCYESEILEIFVLGDDIDFNVTGYTDGELKEKSSMFTYQISVKETEIKLSVIKHRELWTRQKP